ncbi:MAG: hypothetical protein RIB45_14845 [Marivibrio sp.]|uniref:hypothetical protein n=1 Tax=Marivibrio sp. TaxID=2039719 RepID=UPI0032EC9F0F
MTQIVTIGPIAHHCPADTERVDLEIYGVDHFKPSYAAMVFVNDPDVTAETATPDRPSFAGEFAVFGHATCVGDEGHCSQTKTERRRFDTRPSSPLTKAFKRVTITSAALAAAAKGEEMTLTIVASSGDPEADERYAPLLDCTGMQLVSFG